MITSLCLEEMAALQALAKRKGVIENFIWIQGCFHCFLCTEYQPPNSNEEWVNAHLRDHIKHLKAFI